MKAALVLAVGVLVSIAACGGDETTPSGSSSTTTSGAGGSGGGAGGGDAGGGGAGGGGGGAGGSIEPNPGDGTVVPDELAGRVIGHYAMRTQVATLQNVPVLGMTPATNVTYALAEILRNGDGLEIGARGCHVDVESGGAVTTNVPDTLTQSVPASADPFLLWEAEGSVRFARQETIVVLGATLANPETDDLPTSGQDPRVTDQDGDGHPGVTVKVSGLATGDIYVVQRQRGSYAGTLSADGELSGRVKDDSDQSVIGASNPVLNQNVESSQDPDASKSTVSFVKIDDTYDCAQLINELDTLFPAP